MPSSPSAGDQHLSSIDSTWATLQGEWTDSDGTAVVIEGTSACGLDGSELELSVEREGRCTITVGGQCYEGTLAPDGSQLVWSDGAVWERHGDAAAVHDQLPQDSMIEVVVRHALDGHSVKVTLPKRAKFSHLRTAIGRCLDSNGFLANGKMMNKHRGVYRAFKDSDRIGDVREVLVSGADMGGMTAQEVVLGESELSSDEEKSRTRKRGTLPPRRPVMNAGGPLTRSRAIALQTDLLEGFRSRAFQEKLRSLERLRGTENGRFVLERHELTLSVHRKILPKYGFEANQNGVCKMMAQAGAYLEDPELQQLTLQINDSLGIDMPLSTWEGRVQSYKKLTSVATDAARASKPKTSASWSVGSCLAISGGHMLGSTARPEKSPATEAADLEEWPAEKPQPFRLFITGSWNNFKAQEMGWEAGCFTHITAVSKSGRDTFKFWFEGDRACTLYPSIPDATPLDDYMVLGPDDDGHGKSWMIGKNGVEEVTPGTPILIVVVLNANTSIRFVHWQQANAP